MGEIGCSIDGNMNEAKFREPIPWIGLYVAAASLVCGLAMTTDLIHGFRNRKFWFPSKYFSFNATSLTIITVAIKLSVDLNTPMPRRIDQLAKLSSGALICTVMGNFMPSLGTMENKDLMMNVIALGILVITVIVNVGIQLGTGVIYLYWPEHGFIMFLMLVMLLIISFSALIVPTTKTYLEFKYKKKYEMALIEGSNETGKPADGKLKEDLMKFWMMAHTSSPQFVMGRSVTCTASGALCLLSAMTLAEAMLRSYLMPRWFNFCTGESDYKWSSILILFVQTIAVGFGTIGPAIRWFTAVNFRCPRLRKQSSTRVFNVERFWIQLLIEMKECPVAVRFQDRYCRKLYHDAKNRLLDLCIGMQNGIVLSSKAVQLLSVYCVSRLLLFCEFCRKLKLRSNNISMESGSESQNGSALDLSRFVLHLEGEDELVEMMMKNNCDATDQWICKGKKKQPKHLIELVEKSTFSEGFKGVKEFDSDLVASLDHEEPPNCWALPIVTLTAIAITLPKVDSFSCQQLISSVHEGVMYVKLVEDNVDTRGDLIKMRKAAHVVWLGVDLYQKWLDVDLRKLSTQAENATEILEGLAEVAKNKFMEFKNTLHLNRSPKALAANSMYRISKTILLNYDGKSNQMDGRLFDVLTTMISDIVSACLTNLKRVIFLKCLSSSIEEREECIRNSVLLLGKTEKILKLLDKRVPPSLDEDQMTRIDEWRSLHKLNEHSAFHPSSEKVHMAFSSSCDMSLDIV